MSAIHALKTEPVFSIEDDDQLMPAAAVREKLGGVSDMWLWRRLHDDAEFPRPVIMANRRFWVVRHLNRYIEAKMAS